MAGHLKRRANGRNDLEPMSYDDKQSLLNVVRCWKPETPNLLLKWTLEANIVSDVFKEVEESANYLAEYYAFYRNVLKCLKIDDKDGFVTLLDRRPDLVKKFPPYGLFEDVCQQKAVDCAAEFLRRGFSFDINIPFEFTKLTPLDFGALHLSHSLTNLLLRNGANPNIPYVMHSPLLRALRELCYNNYVYQWKDDKSIFKLLYMFCFPDMNEAFATIKLLASHTKQIEEVYGYLIEIGDVCKLASLLMGAKDQLLVPSAEGGGLETTPICQYILEELKSVSDPNSMATNIHPLIRAKRPRLERYKDAYNVIKIMWNAVDILDRYRSSEWIKNAMDYEVPFDVAHDLVNDANLSLKPEDVLCNDIDCFRPSILSKAEVLSKRICFGKPLRSSSRQYPFSGAQPLFSSFSMESFPHHSYHTWQAANFNTIKPREFQSTRKQATNLGASQFPPSPSMSTLHHASHTDEAVNFYNLRPVGINNVLASARRVCAPLIRIAKMSIK